MGYQRTTILAGIDPALLQARLAALQQAYLELSQGAKVVTASYAQADGSRSVTYSQANVADLTAAILALQAQLNPGVASRTPLRPFF